MNLKDAIKNLSAAYETDIIAFRRHLHAHPELAMYEKNTAAFVIEKLKEYNIPYKTFPTHYGIVADIRGNNPGSRVVALRADMDALPIKQMNDVPYKSLTEGLMHACGHDAHTAALLVAGKILNELKTQFDGTIRLIFQPSEEKYPGGATMMLADGALSNPDVQLIFGQHVMPTLDSGKVGVKAGKAMASTDEIFITVKGRGGHAATPDLLIDPVLIAAEILLSLQKIVSRNAPPEIPSVLSFGSVQADGKTNIIPDEVHMAGTFRTFSEAWRAKAHKLIAQTAAHIAEAAGAGADVRIDRGYPFLVNDEQLTHRFKQHAADYLGKDNVLDIELRMTAEDFAYYSQQIPAVFYRLGTRNEAKGITANIHTNTFDIDEEALKNATGLLCWLAVSELSV